MTQAIKVIVRNADETYTYRRDDDGAYTVRSHQTGKTDPVSPSGIFDDLAQYALIGGVEIVDAEEDEDDLPLDGNPDEDDNT